MTDMAEMAVRTAPATDQRIAIRPMTRADVAFAARLHAAALPHGFFARLGQPFLRTYYETFRTSPHAVAFTAEVQRRRAGVLVGTTGNGAHYRWVLRRYGARLAWIGLLALLARPSELIFFLRTRVVRYLRGWLRLRSAAPESGSGSTSVVAVLTHVAVAPEVRSGGTGTALVQAFVDAARVRGCTEACLVTLAGADGAGQFYRRMGWIHVEDRCDADGRGISVFARLL